MCTVCVRCLVTCMPQWARKGKYGREVSSSAPKSSKVSPSGIENKDRSHRSLKPVLLLFFKILLNLRKPSKPSFRPPFQTLDPIFAQQVAILPTRPDRSSVRSGSQRNMLKGLPMYGGLLLDQLGVNFLGPAPLDLELLHMLTIFHWNALGSSLGWWFWHNNTVSCNEKFWVEQVTVPQPPLGKDKGGGTLAGFFNSEKALHDIPRRGMFSMGWGPAVARGPAPCRSPPSMHSCDFWTAVVLLGKPVACYHIRKVRGCGRCPPPPLSVAGPISGG